MTSEPEPASIAAQRHILEAIDAVERGLTCVTFSLDVAHPESGCLPLPGLRAPHSVEGLATYADEIEATLWLDADNWAPAWSNIIVTGCAHGLRPYGVSTAFDLIHAWRALVSRAADHAAQRRSDNPYSLNGRLVLLAEAGQKLAALGGGRHG